MPSHLTREYLEKYANGKVFIETGTYHGETVELALSTGLFDEIHSIELNLELYEENLKRFARNPTVKLWLGDSVDVMKNKLTRIIADNVCTFWLDAHASGPLPGGIHGGCPLVSELESIYGSQYSAEVLTNKHTIFIDDRRLFGSAEWGYVQEFDVARMLKKINPNYKTTRTEERNGPVVLTRELGYLLLDGEVPNDVICATIR
jgi:hypothetical protein